jgi:ADP-dependent NAD(P)H-hydrate dehydratase / NAD(P)H-hydrate epimerase
MKIVTAAEMREIDRLTSEKYSVPSLTLMENAGSAVAEFCLEQYPHAQRIGVICGKGNNGGDGFVAARKLHEAGRTVHVLLLADPHDVKGDAAEMLKKLPLKPIVAPSEAELKSDAAQQVFAADLLIDAILGSGFQPPVTGVYGAAIQQLVLLAGATQLSPAPTGVPIVSIDVPSGMDSDHPRRDASPQQVLSTAAVRASAVVTFTSPKLVHIGLGVPVAVADIGSPPAAIDEASASQLAVATPVRLVRSSDSQDAMLGIVSVSPRRADANKGDFGHVLIVGGSRGKAGAAAMAGIAALRAGAGLATVATARGVQNLVSSFAPELMTEDLAETEQGTISLHALDFGRIDAITEGKTVIAIGPGISRNQESAEFARTLVHRRKLPVVLDADGLNAFEKFETRLEGTGMPLIITPHPGEMARLVGMSVADVQADRVEVAGKFAQDHACIVVLKGHQTVIAIPDGRAWINPTGNPGMGSGGTGDVLTGMIAGLVGGWVKRLPQAENISPQIRETYNWYLVQRVATAVYLHGLAGDIAAAELSEHALVATDLLRYLPAAFARLSQIANEKFRWIGRRV